MTTTRTPLSTELRTDGPNCPTCFNSTLDALRAHPSVNRVTASIASGCVTVDHDDVDAAVLVDIIVSHLHGTAMASSEIVMVSVDPLVTELHCHHSAASHG